MKEIMAKESSGEIQGVPSFEYNPATRSQKVLFEYTRPIDELEDMLLEEYAGTSVAMGEIYTRHNIGRRQGTRATVHRSWRQIAPWKTLPHQPSQKNSPLPAATPSPPGTVHPKTAGGGWLPGLYPDPGASSP